MASGIEKRNDTKRIGKCSWMFLEDFFLLEQEFASEIMGLGHLFLENECSWRNPKFPRVAWGHGTPIFYLFNCTLCHFLYTISIFTMISKNKINKYIYNIIISAIWSVPVLYYGSRNILPLSRNTRNILWQKLSLFGVSLGFWNVKKN